MPRVAIATTLIALMPACVQPEGERHEDGCAHANEVYDDLYAAGAQDAVDGIGILDASWQSIDCTAGPSDEWADGCSACALEAWSAGWQSAPSDADTDTDADTDVDTDTDTDTDTDPPDMCAEEPQTPIPGTDASIDECYTSSLSCGQTYYHTLAGAGDTWAFASQYSNVFCDGIYGAVFPREVAGPDRVYYFDAPPGAEVTVDTACDWLAVRWFLLPGDADCPEPGVSYICDTDNDSVYPPYDIPDMGPNGGRLALVVDTFNGVGGAYTITVDCP